MPSNNSDSGDNARFALGLALSLILMLVCFICLSACGDKITQIVGVNTRPDTVVKHDTTVKVDTVPAPKDTTKTDTTHVSGIAVVLQPAVLVFHLGTGCSVNQVYQMLWEVKHNGMRHSNQNVTFSSVQNAVVSLGSTGLVHPLKTGTALIVATAGADTTAKDTTAVTVDSLACTGGNSTASITVTSPSGTTMRVGSSQQLAAVITNVADPTGTWLSSGPQFVLVNSQSGVATAFSVGSSEVCFSLRTNPNNVPPGCATFTVIP